MDIREIVPRSLLGQLTYDRPETLVRMRCHEEIPRWNQDFEISYKARPYVIAVVGSRRYTNIVHFRTIMDPIILAHLETGVVLVSGGAQGADELAEVYAEEQRLSIVTYLPLWEVHGKYAGYMRNKCIIEACDECVAFWDYRSRGTQNSIDWCRKLDKPVKIVDVRELIVS